MCELFSSVCFVYAPRATPPIDGLLFLQCRAGDRRLRAGGVLVSSQAGCLCFWGVTGQTHTYGEPGGDGGLMGQEVKAELRV